MALLDKQITKSYKNGQSCAEIARSYKVSESTVYNSLKELGIVMRSRSEANQIFPDSIFISLYNVGLSSSQIGRLLGVDSSTVTKRLHILKFPLRSRGVACRIRYTDQEFKKYFMVPGVMKRLIELTSEITGTN